MLLLSVFCCFVLLFISLLFIWERNVKSHTSVRFVVSNSDMNSSFFAIRSYVKLILLEIPRTLRKHSVLAATWNYWSVDSNSPMYIEVIAENIQLPISKLSKFRECIYNNNVKITNGKNNEFNLEEHVLNENLEYMVSYYSLLIGKLQLIAISNTHFPLPILGAVHVSNDFILLKKPYDDIPFKIELRIHKFEKHRSGITFKLNSIISQNNEKIWNCTTTFLSRGTIRIKNVDNTSLNIKSIGTNIQGMIDALGNKSNDIDIKIPKNIGRTFASICGDYNPIHVSPFLAKLFGFKCCIAHGICIYAKSLTQINKIDIPNHYPLHASVTFLSPIFLPSTATIQSTFVSKEKDSSNNTLFISIHSSSKLCIVGTIH